MEWQLANNCIHINYHAVCLQEKELGGFIIVVLPQEIVQSSYLGDACNCSSRYNEENKYS